MICATKSSTILLLLTMSTSTLAIPTGHFRGPGSMGDWWAGRAGKLGGPTDGYHVRTEDVSQAWDATISNTLPLDDNYRVNQNGALGDHQNQRIVRDVVDAATECYLYIDPADKVAPDAGYDFADNLFDIPAGYTNAGYPKTPLPNSPKSLFGASNANGASKGVQILTKAGSKQTASFASVAADKDYMLIYFGAEWCGVCKEFMPRFMEWYVKEKAAGSKFEVVYASNDYAEDFEANFGKMPWMSFQFPEQEHMILNLQNLVDHKSIPYVAVINKKGEIVTCDAIKGMKGQDDKFPLGSRPELFTNEIILPNSDDCSTDPATQRKELQEWAFRLVQGMSEEQLQKFAKKHAIDVSDKTGDALKGYLQAQLKQRIELAQGEELTAFYASLNDPSNYNFKVGDYVRVVECSGNKCKGYFVSDAEGPSESKEVPVYTPADGKRNVGQIRNIAPSDGAIGVQFRNNAWAQVYIKPEHFKYIEQITRDMYENPASKTQ